MRTLFTFLFLLFLETSLCQEVLKGKVIRVADGDTITILDSTNTQYRIRLYGIDCPENGQDFSNVAKKFTSDLVFGKVATIEIRDVDRYSRKVGIVFASDSINVNLALLKSGLAWHYKNFDKSIEFAELEKEARANKVGLWSHNNPVAPWDYRRK